MRDQFTSTGLIPIPELFLDQKNYRLGPLESQMDCIAIMFEEFGPKIIKLAGHMAQKGLSPMPIVVSKDDDDRWVVRDGNRRITALKVLNNPAEAPTSQYQRIFQNIKDNSNKGVIPASVDCLTATESVIVDYRELVHMGEQEGVGQIPWGAVEKQYQMADISGKFGYPHAMAIRQYLQGKGLTEARTVPITNMQRLFEDADVCQRLGMIWDGKDFTLKTDEGALLEILKVICQDFVKKSIGVKDIYHKDDRKKYLDELFGSRGFKEPIIGTTKSSGTTKTTTSSSSANAGGAPTRTKLPKDRARLIQRGLSLPVPVDEAKIYTILVELGSKIDVREATIAASVLFRLVVERSVDYYADKNGITFGQKEGYLHQRIGKVGEHMESSSLIKKKQVDQLKRMSQNDQLISTSTLNSWVHASTDIPKASELCIFWDNIRFFLYQCWK